MAKVTLVFALLLIALGVIGFAGTGSQHYTALIPAWIGIVIGLCGALALGSNPKRRMIAMHISVTVALLGFLGTVSELIRGTLHAHALGTAPNANATGSKIALAVLLLIYVLLCVRSFIAARKARLV